MNTLRDKLMNKLRYNLMSGDSYITQDEPNPAETGEILADNFEAAAIQLFGEDFTDEDMEKVLDIYGANPAPWYSKDFRYTKK